MFLQTASVAERVNHFRKERLQIIAANAGPVRLADQEDKIIIHLISLTEQQPIDLSVAMKQRELFSPISDTSGIPRFNLDGLCSFRSGTDCHGYTQLFREGHIEATRVGLVRNYQRAPAISAEEIRDLLLKHVPKFINGLRVIGINPPIYIGVSLQGTYGAKVICTNDTFFITDSVSPLAVSEVLLPICILEDFGTDESYRGTLKPALDALWNAGGFSSYPG
ncbi:hypothetical protein ACFSM5_11325 [Lacibacterium aquatile]|uniref:Uncharacterized protein n=1 Tax=Lacibacterium aquatile TaxID=1168082 RepID=A0ABW5DVH6_9PROT